MFNNEIKVEFEEFYIYYKFNKAFIINIIKIKKLYAFIINLDQ